MSTGNGATTLPKRRVKGWGVRRERGTMNALEQKFWNEFVSPRLVSGSLVWARFEPAKFRLVDKDKLTTFEPDIFVQEVSGELVYYEVKGGLFPEKNRMKCKLFADQYPIRLVVAQYKNKATGWTFEEF